jgi:hypothetical protein
MATNITPIDPDELTGHGVIGLPDAPELDVLDMQRKFDDIALNIIIPHINGMVTEIDAAVDGAIAAAEADVLTEKARAQFVEASLSTAVSNEETRARAAEGLLSNAIDAEKTRAEGAEGTLSGAINTEKLRAEGVESGLSTSIQNERDRARGVESSLAGQINSVARNLNTLNIQFDELGLRVVSGKLCAVYNT